MAGNRASAEAIILEYIEKIVPNGPTTQIYRDLFADMDDEKFDTFMEEIGTGRKRLVLIAPNLSKTKISIERNIELAEELGHDFFQRIWMSPGKDLPIYLTPKKYLVIDVQLRRQAQHLEKKIRIPNNNQSIDELTGQPSGASKGSKISYPEVQILAALNLPHSLTEKLKFRGGDVRAFDAMNDAIDKQGAVSMKAIEHLTGKVESTRTFGTFLRCMHLENPL